MNHVKILAVLVTYVKANKWVFLETNLPKPMSDMTATYDSGTSKIYIFGGCDSYNGNERLEPGSSIFACNSITESAYAFDPTKEKFLELKDMPRERHRHSASLVNGKIWVVGGRDVEDSIVYEIDVYDPVTNEWATPTAIFSLDRSDFGMFSVGQFLYIVGGYDTNYNAMNTTIQLDTETLDVKELSNLIKERGDIHVEHIGDFAYVTGGFTHSNGFCQALNSTEKYDIKNNEWKSLPSMNQNRGDQALVGVEGALYVLGGEYKVECTGDPGEYTSASDEVDMLDLTSKNSDWVNIGEIPDDRFRFVGEAFPETDTIYVFGGQKYFDPDGCSCYATSDKVMAYSVSSGTSITAFWISSVIFSVFVALF